MQQQRQTRQTAIVCRLIRLYVIGSILGSSCSLFALNGQSIRLATAFASPSSVKGDTVSMNGRGNSEDNDDDTKKFTAAQSESAVLTETGSIEPPSNKATPVPLLLPASDDNNENITSIRLGETISFAELGPIILNTDGTIRRIDNWKTLTKQEQETTWRRIQKRNAQRREQLLLEQEQRKEAEQSNNQSSIE